MKKTITILLSVVMTFSLCGSVFADPDPENTEDSTPVLGSWYLDRVLYQFDDDDVDQQSSFKMQSLYRPGGDVFSFDENGTAHEMIYDSTDSMVISAEWESVSPDVYYYTDENGLEIEFHYDAGEDVLHWYDYGDAQNTDSPEQDFVYVRAAAGSWQLDRVVQITEEPDESEAADQGQSETGEIEETGEEDDRTQISLPKEENQSLYAEEGTIYTFEADGKGKETIQDGPDTAENSFIWMTAGPDEYALFDPEAVDSQVEQAIPSDGDSSEAAPELQERLRDLGYLDAQPDGDSGLYTGIAVREFQMFNGLAITGIADAQTQEVLYGGSAQRFVNLARGMSGDQVYMLQQILVQRGYLDDEPDGKFGNLTEDAVVRFQQENDISPADGVAGRLTCDALMSDPDLTVPSNGPEPKMVLSYFREDDTLYRDVITEDPDAAYPHLRFIYRRTELTEDQGENQGGEQLQTEWVPIEMPETPQIELPVYSEPPEEESEVFTEDPSEAFSRGEDAPVLTPEL